MLDQRNFTENSKNAETISSSQTISFGSNCTKTMVKLYCAEQIAIPEPFPNVLKTFAKAAIRTQPYDILRWSAGYFRCLANNLPPPAKKRLEKDCHHGSLTRGYLRVLLDQLGKGFFIERKLLQKRWMALSLPEDQLLRYLSLARMLHWPQVHWLKLVAVMVGSMNNSLEESLTMFCELITDDIEGGLARVPYWMFKICYIFLAQLESSEEQCFVDGRKVLPWGDLEPVRKMEGLPRILSATFLKDNIIEQCRRKLGKEITCECNRHKERSSSSNFDDIEEKCSKISIPSGFEFLNGKDGQTFVIDKCADFDSLILFLREADECPAEKIADRKHFGPHYISEAQMKHAIDHEEKLLREREYQALVCKERADQFTQEERIKMLKEIGPPWTWLHNFVDSDCKRGSYNFIEEESIPSDVTPEESSDDSFDFIQERPVGGILSDVSIETEKTSSVDLLDILEIVEDGSSTTLSKQVSCLQDLIDKAESNKKCNVQDTSSVISFLQQEELGVLVHSGGPFSEKLDIAQVIDYLRQAQTNGVTFENVLCLSEYIRDKMNVGVKLFLKEPSVVKMGTSSSLETSKSSMEDDDADLDGDEEDERNADERQQSNKDIIINTRSMTKLLKATESSEELDLDVIFEINEGISVTKLYDKSGITPDAQADSEQVPEEMILGLMDEAKVYAQADVISVQSDITKTDMQSEKTLKGAQSDDSSIFATTDSEDLPQIDYRAFCGDEEVVKRQKGVFHPPFRCTIPPYPGIGPAVSPVTIDIFLAYLKFRACSQRGLITPQNFHEEKCPFMVDTVPYCNPNPNPNPNYPSQV